MEKSIRKILVAMVLIFTMQTAIAISLSNWVVLLKDPWRFSGAIADAVFSGSTQYLTDRDPYSYYQDVLGISLKEVVAMPSPTKPNLCTFDQLHIALSPNSKCMIANASAECKNIDGCALVKVDPSLLADDALRANIIRSVTDPCSQLRNPDSFSSGIYDSHLKSMYYSARVSWLALSCDGKKLMPKVVMVDEKVGTIKLSF